MSRRLHLVLHLALILALILVLTAPGTARAAELRAGVGRADITPPVGTPLGGYADRKGAPSTGVHDPIMAKALVLDDGTTRLGIITSDLVGTNPEMVRKVAAATGFPQDHLLICASHTHSGPGAYGRGAFATIALGAFRQPVFDEMADGMARALRQAEGSLQPAALAVGVSKLPGFMRNRRHIPLIDPALWLLRVDTATGKPLALLLDLTAHGTVLGSENMQLSADWMGATQALLEREIPGVTALYANGAEGDISPNIPDHSSTFEGAQAHGEKAGHAALELYRMLHPEPSAKLAVRTAPLTLPKSFAASLLGAGKQTTLQCMQIADALLIAVPGELTTQLGLALKAQARRQGYAHPVIIGLANDHLGYFLTRAEMKRGGYEAEVSFFGEGFGEELTLALARLIGGDTAPVQAALAVDPRAPAKGS